MAGENLVSIKISDEMLTEIRDLLTQLESKLGSVVIALSADQKKALPKANIRLLPFVNKVVAHTETNPEIIPSYVSGDELKVDVAAVNVLTEIYNRLKQIMEPLNDTITLSGSEAYQAGLKVYALVKALAKANVPGMQAIFDDLKVFFAKASKSETTGTQQ
jgi:hypothetical protein